MSPTTEPVTHQPTVRPSSRWSRRRLEGLVFVAPLVVGIALFQAYPLGVSLWASLTDWDGLSEPTFTGLDNFRRMTTDADFLNSVRTTLIFTVVSIPVIIALALVLALFCNAKGVRGKAFFRVAYFTPYVTSIVAMSLVFTQFFAPSGLVNGILGTNVAWLTNSSTALGAVIVVAVWQGVGYPMVILLAGLQGVPVDLYEAARVDGASAGRQLVSITLPLLTPQLFFVLITQFILSFQVFGVIFVMTQGGPGTATSVFIFYLFQNAFTFGQLGYASAMAWVMFLVIIVVTVVQWRLQKRWVFYS